MKIRKGFVTNSSSSSFILAYNEESIVSDLWKQLEAQYDAVQAGEYLGYLMDYLNKEENAVNDLEAFLQKFAERVSWEIEFEYRQELEDNGMDYKESRAEVKSENGQNEIQRRVDERVEKLRKAIHGFNTVKRIEISDDYEPLTSLEYRVVRNLNECKDVRSCH